MNPNLYKSRIPPVTKEFIDAMKSAFPNKKPDAEASIGAVQRNYGRQDVIDWAIQFMRTHNPEYPTGR